MCHAVRCRTCGLVTWRGCGRHVDLAAAHDIANEVQHRMLHDVPKLADVTVHVSPSSASGRDHHGVLIHHPTAR